LVTIDQPEMFLRKVLPIILIDDPPMFGPMEELERYLARVQAMPNFFLKASLVKQAKWCITRLKRSPRPAQLSFQFLNDIESRQPDKTNSLAASEHVQVNRPANGTTYQPAEGVKLHPGEAGVVWGRTAQDARLRKSKSID
jgi:hypothetical protein